LRNRLNKDSDGALVAATKRGDTQALRNWFFVTSREFLAVARRITNNREDAEDVAQESFHKAFLHLDDFSRKVAFSTGLTRITMNERSCCSVESGEFRSLAESLTMREVQLGVVR